MHFLEDPRVLWVAAIFFGAGVFGTLMLSVLVFGRIVKRHIGQHEDEEKKLNALRLKEDEKRHQDRLAEDAKRHSERLEDERRRHAETLEAVRNMTQGASVFPARVAAQYERLNSELDETSERVDALDERLTKTEKDQAELKERFDRYITLGGHSS